VIGSISVALPQECGNLQTGPEPYPNPVQVHLRLNEPHHGPDCDVKPFMNDYSPSHPGLSSRMHGSASVSALG